ncbi:aldose epimerase family protein [Streptomyces sp. SL13]|uniref:Aldose 1-epimerase n=1 Tax=Streptantibioticus silvisoli TaxID=2705255 RepID=A0AA90KB92_9ACTN|nr:aldose epimerase family protein [Streptantibioticus silvisoli]MDI5973348.1 aldose epimerase family protein [Streptantibioticus silvisoli]
MPAATTSCSVFGTLPDGRTVHRWSLIDPIGTRAEILTLGAALHAFHVPDRHGEPADVVLSPGSLADRLAGARYFGATVGRYANRIARGRLPTPAGHRQLSTNERGNTLHGGTEGFDARVWQARPVGTAERAGVELTLTSPADDQGFPGALQVAVRYTVHEGALSIDYRATCDVRTPVSLTNHTYWNLAGGTHDTVHEHELYLAADHYLPVDAELIPLPGPPRPVAGTPFDLTAPRRLAGVLDDVDDGQLRTAGGGYDHNWALRPRGGEPEPAAVLRHPGTGRVLECLTTEPGIQVYTANGFDGAVTGAGGRPLPRYAGVALETQHFPDSPRRPDYPTTWLEPGRVHRSTTIYRPGVMT